MTLQAPLGTKHVYGEEHVRNVLMVGFPLPYHPNVCFLFCVCICTIVIFCFNTIVFYIFFRFLISCDRRTTQCYGGYEMQSLWRGGAGVSGEMDWV